MTSIPIVNRTQLDNSSPRSATTTPAAPPTPEPWNPIGTFVTALLQQLAASVRDTFLSNPIAQAIWAQFRPIEGNAASASSPIAAGAPPTTSTPLVPTLSRAVATGSPNATTPGSISTGSLTDAGGQIISPNTASQIALSNDGSRAYVSVTTYDQPTNQYTYYVQQVDTATQQPLGDRILVSGRLVGIALTQQGDRLYVATADGSGGGDLDTLETRTNTIGSDPVHFAYGEPAGKIAVSSDGNTVYLETASNTGNGNGGITAVNTQTGVLTGIPSGYPVVTGPVLLDETQGRLYAGKIDGSYAYGQVSVTNLQTGQVALVYVGGSPSDLALSPDSRTLYVNLYQGGIAAIDTTTLALTKTYQVPLLSSTTKSFALSPDGKYLTVAGFTTQGSTVIEIATATGDAVGVATGLGYTINSMRYSPDGTHIYTVGTADAGGYFGSLSTTAGNPTDGTGTGGGTTNPGGGTTNPGTGGGTTNPGAGTPGVAQIFSALSFALDLIAGTHAAEVLAPVGAIFSGINIVSGIANVAAGAATNNSLQQIGGALQILGGTIGLLALLPGPQAPFVAGVGLLLDVTGILLSLPPAASTSATQSIAV